MDRVRPIVIRLDEAAPPSGTPTAGMDRRQLFEDRDRWVGWLRTEPGVAGGWHHHGRRDTYIYSCAGDHHRVRPRATTRDGTAWTLFNPAGMVHREEPSRDPAEAFLVRIGPAEIVNVTSERQSGR